MPMVGATFSLTRVRDADSIVSRCHFETDARVHLHGGKDAYACLYNLGITSVMLMAGGCLTRKNPL
jgi:hypothetical protein